MIPYGQLCRGGRLGCTKPATKRAVDGDGRPGQNDFYYACDEHLKSCALCGRSELVVLVDLAYPTGTNGDRVWKCQDGRCEEYQKKCCAESPECVHSEAPDTKPIVPEFQVCPVCDMETLKVGFLSAECVGACAKDKKATEEGRDLWDIAVYVKPPPFKVRIATKNDEYWAGQNINGEWGIQNVFDGERFPRSNIFSRTYKKGDLVQYGGGSSFPGWVLVDEE